MIRIRYQANNSGGDWWLSDKDWQNLETAGWKVSWGEPWLGAMATEATVLAPSLDVAIADWERITGQNSSAEGCACCGQPHQFFEEE